MTVFRKILGVCAALVALDLTFTGMDAILSQKMGGIHCVVLSYKPEGHRPIQIGEYVGTKYTSATATVRLDSGKTERDAFAIGDCVPGMDAKIEALMGAFTHHLIAVLEVSCLADSGTAVRSAK